MDIDICLTHNTETSGPDGAPVVVESGVVEVEDRANWHESTEAEIDAYEAYWNAVDDARTAAEALWEAVAAALPAAKHMYFDGCHKIYLAMDAAEDAKFKAEDWPQSSRPDLSVLHTWFDSSCFLRFIYAVSANPVDPNAGYVKLIPQGAIE